MPTLKIVTVNILFEMNEWSRRRELLAKGLAAQQADLIALQEVKLPENTAAWLAERLDMPHVYLVPHSKPGPNDVEYGVAILSRRPFKQKTTLDLQGQGRVAQFVEVDIDGHSLMVCNGHYYWHPGPTPRRVNQVQRVLDRLSSLPPEVPIVALGDFNGTPETPAIALMRSHFSSAYAMCHGGDPEYTSPTPLAYKGWRRSLRNFLINWKANRTLTRWRGTLDYIFVSSNLNVLDCKLILTRPAPNDGKLYASDHFGLVAKIELNNKRSV